MKGGKQFGVFLRQFSEMLGIFRMLAFFRPHVPSEIRNKDVSPRSDPRHNATELTPTFHGLVRTIHVNK